YSPTAFWIRPRHSDRRYGILGDRLQNGPDRVGCKLCTSPFFGSGDLGLAGWKWRVDKPGPIFQVNTRDGVVRRKQIQVNASFSPRKTKAIWVQEQPCGALHKGERGNTVDPTDLIPHSLPFAVDGPA